MLTQIIKSLISITRTCTEQWNMKEPLNTFICVFFLTLFCSFLVLIIGFLIQHIKQFIYGLFAKNVGEGWAKFICFRLTFPGTIIHEMSHATFAFLTGAKVNKIQCFSIKKDTLGYVEYTPQGNLLHQMLQHSVASCAPVLSGIVLTPIFASLALNSTNIPLTILFWYLAICVLLHMNMSDVDIKNYFKGYPILFIILYCINYFLVKGLQ